MKLFEIYRGRDKIDKYTFIIHNPLWFLLGIAIGYCLGYGIGKYSHYVDKIIGG